MQSNVPGLSAEHRQTGDFQTLTFEHILKQLKPRIERYASRYPEFWQADFYQEGVMALYDAYQKFIILPSKKDFRSYALKAVENRMFDFYNKNFDRAPEVKDIVLINEDGQEDEEYIYNVTGDIDFFTTATFDMDYQVVFNPENLKVNGFTDSEIRVFNLRAVDDLTITEIAGEFKISVGRASQIMASLREKSSTLIKRSFN